MMRFLTFGCVSVTLVVALTTACAAPGSSEEEGNADLAVAALNTPTITTPFDILCWRITRLADIVAAIDPSDFEVRLPSHDGVTFPWAKVPPTTFWGSLIATCKKADSAVELKTLGGLTLPSGDATARVQTLQAIPGGARVASATFVGGARDGQEDRSVASYIFDGDGDSTFSVAITLNPSNDDVNKPLELPATKDFLDRYYAPKDGEPASDGEHYRCSHPREAFAGATSVAVHAAGGTLLNTLKKLPDGVHYTSALTASFAFTLTARGPAPIVVTCTRERSVVARNASFMATTR